MGRYRQPVQEWTYSDIEKSLAEALSSELGQLKIAEARDLMAAREMEDRAKREKRAQKQGTLGAVLGLAGTVAPYAIPGISKGVKACYSALKGLLSSKKKGAALTGRDSSFYR